MGSGKAEIVVKLVGEKPAGENGEATYRAKWNPPGSLLIVHGSTREEAVEKLREQATQDGEAAAAAPVRHEYGPYEQIAAPSDLPGNTGGVKQGHAGTVIERLPNPAKAEQPAVMVEYADELDGQAVAFAIYSPDLSELWSFWQAG